jgi:4-carboxymuconolactone decarboxylase
LRLSTKPSGNKHLYLCFKRQKIEGITDKVSKQVTPVIDNLSKYERGKKVLKTLTGKPEKEPKTGFAAFSPEVEVFLKEHLFSDLFSRDVLSYSDREIATITALINLGGVEPMMQSHMGIAFNLGITEQQLKQLLNIVELNVGKAEADAGLVVLVQAVASRNSVKK